MKKGKYSSERLLEEIVKLEPIQFLGICKILGINTYERIEEEKEEDAERGRVTEEPKPRDFMDMWKDLCDKVDTLNRTRRRNLGTLVYAATKKDKGDKNAS